MVEMNDPAEFQLILVDPTEALCDAFREHFRAFPNVMVQQGYFQDLTAIDCMVSAANSFGLMGGGVDRAIIQFFGDGLEGRVRQYIIDEFRGEQPVGTSFIIETGHTEHPYLAHTPTMRFAMPIACTDNVYRATQAMLLAVWRQSWARNQKIEIVACLGLGTATGRLPYSRAAKQMALAYEHFINPPSETTRSYAHQRQELKGYGGDEGFMLNQREGLE